MPAERMSIETQKLLTFITWDWQPMDTILELALDGVPPGKAIRKYQARAAANARNKPASGEGTPKRPLTEDEQIVSGARDILRGAIYSQVKSDRLEVMVGAEGERFVRFKERRIADENGCCVACRRPFEKAAESKPPAPSPRPKVVFPHFPTWQAEAHRKGAS